MSAIEVLSEQVKGLELMNGSKLYTEHSKKLHEDLEEALLVLKKQKNGLKCIGCGSIPKLKLCCNSCYQGLKLKEKRQVELIEWLEKEIELCYNHPNIEGFPERIMQYGKDKRVGTLKEVLERVGEQK